MINIKKNDLLPSPFEQLTFLTEARLYHKCPADFGNEVAFVGRSNTGKSSLINAITRNRKMAITSRSPGRTRGMVFFGWPESELRLVDLPGYGFARTNAQTRQQWHQEINNYLHKRRSLNALLLLIDCRRGIKDTEIELIHWCQQQQQLRIVACLTKADKLKSHAKQKAIHSLQTHPVWQQPPEIHMTSVLQPATIVSIRQRVIELLSTPIEQKEPSM